MAVDFQPKKSEEKHSIPSLAKFFPKKKNPVNFAQRPDDDQWLPRGSQHWGFCTPPFFAAGGLSERGGITSWISKSANRGFDTPVAGGRHCPSDRLVRFLGFMRGFAADSGDMAELPPNGRLGR